MEGFDKAERGAAEVRLGAHEDPGSDFMQPKSIPVRARMMLIDIEDVMHTQLFGQRRQLLPN
jgi:hypothetical protein